jgi:hypothetical protein
LNECACNPYNADFDGDEMNMREYQSVLSVSAVLILSRCFQTFRKPKRPEQKRSN